MHNNLPTKTAMVLALAGMSLAVCADDVLFKQLDKDADGYISAEEAGAHQALTMGYINADTNEDGKIDNAEFSAFEAQDQFMQPAQDK